MFAWTRSSTRRFGDADLHWSELAPLAPGGSTLVLLHGLNDSHRTWTRIAPALGRTHRILALDLPGHGLSGRPDASYTLAWYAGVLARWMDEEVDGPVDVVGHSFGGGVAQWLLLERPERIRRLALVAPGGLGRGVSTSLRLASATSAVERFGQPFMGLGTKLAMRALGGTYDAEEISFLAWANARAGTARAFARTVRDVIGVGGQKRHFLDHAREIAHLPPIALFWGDRDRVLPVGQAHAMTKLVEGIALTTFPGCGHFPHRERPDEMAQALEDFVGAGSPPAARIVCASVVHVPRAVRRPSAWGRFFGRVWSRVRRTFATRRRRFP